MVLSEYRRALERRGLMPGTVQQRLGKLRSFERWLERPLFSAEREDVERFLDARKVGSRTRYCWLSHLSCYYRWAIDEGHATSDPTARIMRPRLRRTLPRPMADGDLAMALEAAHPVMRAWLALAAYGGLRCAEIAALNADDLMFAESLLRLHGKGGKERIVPMHPFVAETLRRAGVPRRGALFRRPRGGRYPAAMVSREGSLYLHDLGIEATLHQARHWYATNCLRACRDLRVVQELLGHASPTTTAIYTQFSQVAAAEAVFALGHQQVTLFAE